MDEKKYKVCIDLTTDMIWVSYAEEGMPVRRFDRSGGYGSAGIRLMLTYLKNGGSWLLGEDGMGHPDSVFYRGLMDMNRWEGEKGLTLLVKIIDLILNEIIDHNPGAVIELLAVTMEQSCLADIGRPLQRRLVKPYYPETLVVSREDAAFDFAAKSYPEEPVWTLFAGEKSTGLYQPDPLKGYVPVFLDDGLGYGKLDNGFATMVADGFEEENSRQQDDDFTFDPLQAIINQYIPICYQKYGAGQDIKIYYNFAFPPFQKTFSYEALANQVASAGIDLARRLDKIAELSRSRKPKLMVVGNESRIPWMKPILENYFQLIKSAHEEVVGYGALMMKPFSLVTPSGEILRRLAAGHREKVFIGTFQEEAPQKGLARFRLTYGLDDCGELETTWEYLKI